MSGVLHKYTGHGKPTACGLAGGSVVEATAWVFVTCPACLATRKESKT